MSVHRYLRAVGFSNIKKREELQELINEVVTSVIAPGNSSNIENTSGELNNSEKEKMTQMSQRKSYQNTAADEEDNVYAEMFLEVADGVGVCVRGEYGEDNVFMYEYYFPYIRSTQISSNEDITVERQAEKESYAGVCDDIKVGVSLIFYLQNMVPYIKMRALNRLPVKGTSLMLSALSINGTIMMPINKNEQERQKVKKASSERNQLLAQARNGDENAIESLTLEDMDTYTAISRKIHNEDVFSLVDTYFMPYGVECDQYSIMGEIQDVRLSKNYLSGEEVVVMTVECNELTFDVCINRKDLYGEPAVGRRFKGIVWLQGYINFPREVL